MGSFARRGKWVAMCSLHLEIKRRMVILDQKKIGLAQQKGGRNAQGWGTVKGGCPCLNKMWESSRSFGRSTSWRGIPLPTGALKLSCPLLNSIPPRVLETTSSNSFNLFLCLRISLNMELYLIDPAKLHLIYRAEGFETALLISVVVPYKHTVPRWQSVLTMSAFIFHSHHSR